MKLGRAVGPQAWNCPKSKQVDQEPFSLLTVKKTEEFQLFNYKYMIH